MNAAMTWQSRVPPRGAATRRRPAQPRPSRLNSNKLAVALTIALVVLALAATAAAMSQEERMKHLAGIFSPLVSSALRRFTGIPVGGACGYGTPYYSCWNAATALGVPKGGACVVGTAKGLCSPLCSRHQCDL